MKHCNRKNSIVFRMAELTAIATLITVGCGLPGMGASRSTLVAKRADSPIVAKCKADLANRLKLQTNSIKLVSAQPTTWPDAALGMPEPGKMYAQMMTPGSIVTLEARGTRYVYTTSAKAYKYGGPVSIWSYSILYTKPVPNDADLNGDLYQCSALGTNCIRVASGVTDYYPQNKGVVIVKRRTSRSGHDLLYVKVGSSAKPKLLHSAFDFGEAALNDSQDKWAGFVRPMVGGAWTVVVARIGGDTAKPQVLPLPDGVRPGQIAWSGGNLMILAKNGERATCFEISQSAPAPTWKAVGVHLFPGLPDYMLNKSETLEIDQIKENGRSSVEVALVWFTGDRNVKARINDVTLRGYDFLAGRYAFVWGEKNSAPVAYSVDISTGEVIAASSGIGGSIRPFMSPPQHSPIISGR